MRKTFYRPTQYILPLKSVNKFPYIMRPLFVPPWICYRTVLQLTVVRTGPLDYSRVKVMWHKFRPSVRRVLQHVHRRM